MNQVSIFLLKCLSHGYSRFWRPTIKTDYNTLGRKEGNELLYKILSSDRPCMIARYGANEINCISNYLAIKNNDHNIWKIIKGESHGWWWNKGMLNELYRVAGFFPIDDEHLSRFSELMLEDSKDLDVLAIFPSVYKNLPNLLPYIPTDIPLIQLVSFDSFLYDNPWTKILKGRNVLVIHPFAELIEEQYKNRNRLFNNTDVLPSFNLITIKAVQSMSGVNTNGYKDWFEGLCWMKEEMDKQNYDIVLLGCGAYGFPLAAHAKRTGHKAVHIGGSLQLLFGIKGKRWENPLYGHKVGIPQGTYSELLKNSAWVSPTAYRTRESEKAENACYW